MRELVALLLGVFEERLDLLVLHLVLDWAEEVGVISIRASFEGLGELNHGSQEVLVDALVNEDTLRVDTDLARVEPGAHGTLLGGTWDVNVWKDDGGVVAAQLKCDAFQSPGTGSHDLLAGSN